MEEQIKKLSEQRDYFEGKANEHYELYLREKIRREELQTVLEEVRSIVPLTQDESESPNFRYNAGNMIIIKINQALEGGENI